MLKDGMKLRAISLKLDRSYQMVKEQRKYMARVDGSARVKRPYTLFSGAEDAQMLALRAKGSNWREVHSQMPHRSAYTLRLRFRSLNTQPRDHQYGISRRWTIQEVGTLRDMFTKGLSTESMAAELQRNVYHIRNKLRREGLQRQTMHWSRDHIAQLMCMRKDGLTFKEIGIRLERPASLCMAAYYRHRDQSAQQQTRWSRDMIAQLMCMRKNDLTFEEIGKHLERSASACMAAYYRHRDQSAATPQN